MRQRQSFKVPDYALHKNSDNSLIDNSIGLRKKRGEAATASASVCSGVGEAVPDQHRADSLNTGWVKVPVKFPALAVVAAEQGWVDRREQPIDSFYSVRFHGIDKQRGSESYLPR